MSTSQMEYMNLCVHRVKYYEEKDDFYNTKNFEKNMEIFDQQVMELLEKGWRPNGGPQFSEGWYTGHSFYGKAIQSLVRVIHYDDTNKKKKK